MRIALIVLPFLLSACAVGDGLATLASGAADGTKYLVKHAKQQTATTPSDATIGDAGPSPAPASAEAAIPPAASTPSGAPVRLVDPAPVETIELAPLPE